MKYYKDGKTYTRSEIKALYKNVSYKDPVQLGYVSVLPTPKPDCETLQMVISDGVEEDTLGNIVEKWSIVDRFSNTEEATKEEQETAYLTELTQREFEVKKKEFETSVYQLVQTKVDEYNLANGLSLKDVYTCKDYSTVPAYTHQPFCEAVWLWNVSVWEYLRTVLAAIASNEIEELTVEEFLESLPQFVYA